MSKNTGTNPSHDCNDSLNERWHHYEKGFYTTCGVCNKVTGFHYHSFFKRLRALFHFFGSNTIK